jgi:glycosyltransferase involved in cell wall biosynthesis
MTKVSLIIRFTPYYRTGVFNLLGTLEDIDLCLVTYKHEHIRLPQLDPADVRFCYINTKAYYFRLFGRTAYLQPKAITATIRNKSDVIIVYNHMADLTTWIMLLLGKITGKKIILWGHGKGSIDKEWKNTSLRNFYMRLAKANLFYNYEAYGFWSRHIRKESLFVAPNSLDTNISKVFYQKHKDSLPVRKHSVCFIGRLTPLKNLPLVLNIIHTLRREFPDILLSIVGDGPERPALEKLTMELGMADNVTFYGELFEEEPISKILIQSWLTLLPNFAGLSIQHSMAYGTPVVIGNDHYEHGPEASLVMDGKTGLVCYDNDIPDFVTKISFLFREEKRREEMSRNSFNLITTEYSVEKMADGFYKAINYCMKK